MKIDTRFWNKVDIRDVNECWEWQGAKNKKYGVCRFNIKQISTHRLAWILTYGNIPDGMCVCHTCDNHPCCNPRHLFLGTVTENNLDMVNKGRQVWGENNGAAKLTEDMVREIRAAKGSQRKLAKIYGISQGQISVIQRGDGWKQLE